MKLPFRPFEQGFYLCKYVSKQLAPDLLSDLLRMTKDINSTSVYCQEIINGWANWLSDYINQQGVKVDIVARVPGHDEKIINRSKVLHLIARQVANKLNCSFEERLVLKKFVTTPQRNIPLADFKTRNENIAGSFRISNRYKNLKYQNVLVIDDVIGTKATMREVGSALYKVGSTNKIYFIALGASATTANRAIPDKLFTYFKNIPIGNTKVCKDCNTEQPIENFNILVEKRKTKVGIVEFQKVNSYCRQCNSKRNRKNTILRENEIREYQKVYRKEYRKNNKEKENERKRKWVLKNPDKKKEIEKRYLEKKKLKKSNDDTNRTDPSTNA